MTQAMHDAMKQHLEWLTIEAMISALEDLRDAYEAGSAMRAYYNAVLDGLMMLNSKLKVHAECTG